jgi:hypothetical protein
MAYDAEPGGDPRGTWCKKCQLPIMDGQPTTQMHFREDPDGKLGFSGLYHATCAQPYWDTVSWVLKLGQRGH